MKPKVEIVIEDRKWCGCRGLSRQLAEATQLALLRGRCRRKGIINLAILLTSNSRLKTLNARFRGKNATTNVLSFESVSDGGSHLGDLALAYGVVAREARAQGKSLIDHATHLVVHGALHLLGFDHDNHRDAARMEALEVSILAELGISDPYTARAKAA